MLKKYYEKNKILLIFPSKLYKPHFSRRYATTRRNAQHRTTKPPNSRRRPSEPLRFIRLRRHPRHRHRTMESIRQDTTIAQHVETTKTTTTARVLRRRRYRTRDRRKPQRPQRAQTRRRLHDPSRRRTTHRTIRSTAQPRSRHTKIRIRYVQSARRHRTRP